MPLLAPMSGEGLWAIRSLVAVPSIILVVILLRDWHQVDALWRRIREKPVLALGLLACGLMLAAQIWVFGWAPVYGRGLQVALGYFLLPLVLVVVGRLLYRDRLAWWQWLAAGVAAIGVVAEIIRVGGISWETLLVALGYPVYFIVRRWLGFNNMGGTVGEQVIVLPIAIYFVVVEIVDGRALRENPAIWWLGPIIGVVASLALLLYLIASKLLPLSTFGLLSYLEPALLMIAALMLGEAIAPEEYTTYAAIWVAVLIVIIGGVVQLARSRKPLA